MIRRRAILDGLRRPVGWPLPLPRYPLRVGETSVMAPEKFTVLKSPVELSPTCRAAQ